MTLVVTHSKVSTKPVGNDTTRIYSDSWNANHVLTGTTDATQLNANVVQSVTNDTNIQGTISNQNLTFAWGGTLAAARLNANVVQAVTNDTNITGSISAQNLTFSWSGFLGLNRGGTNADLSATGGAANYLKQISAGAAVTVGTIPASDIASGTALTSANDTNVTITLGGTPASALLKATSLTMGWTGTLAVARGGTGGGTASGTLLDNITGFASTGFLTRTGAGTYAFQSTTNGITNSNLAQAAAYTLKGNSTGSTANISDFTIDSLTAKVTPTTSDELLIWDVAGSAMKKITIATLPAGAVSSVVGNGVTITSSGTIPPPYGIVNHSLAVSASAGALTIALKDNAGADPTVTSPVNGYFRNVTGTTGSWTQLTVTAALSLTVNSGATLGVTSSTAFRLWVVLFNDAATARLGVINCSTSSQIFPLVEGVPTSSTAVSGSSNSAGVLYTGTAVSSKSFLIVGYVEWSSTGLTAGTWTTTNLNFVQSYGPGIRRPGETVQIVNKGTNTVTSTTNTSGSPVDTNLSQAITPTSAANIIRVSYNGNCSNSVSSNAAVTKLLRSATAIGGTYFQGPGSASVTTVTQTPILDFPNTASAVTYKVQLFSDGTGTVTFATGSGVASQPFASMVLEEIMG